MTRRAGLALANAIAWIYITPWFWGCRYHDKHICRWANDTAGDDES